LNALPVDAVAAALAAAVAVVVDAVLPEQAVNANAIPTASPPLNIFL
jgi:hypothetical protein